MDEDRKLARRGWRGNLNDIPVSIAYDFELEFIIENDPAQGFRGSRSRVQEARDELVRRKEEALIWAG